MLINDASITGSLIVNASASFQNILVGGNIIPDTTNLRNLGSTDKFFKEIYVSTGSINFVDNGSVVAVLSAGTINAIQSNTSSANDRLDTIQNTTSSLNTFTASISTTNTFTSSATARLNALETTSASVDTLNTNQNNRLGSLETISASNISRISSLETTSASVDTLNTNQNNRLNALETTSASVDTLNTTQNSRLGSLEAKTGSLATTGSNTFVGTQVITGSLYVTTDLIVQGSSSLQNITASAVSIGTNLINLNTANPAIRFAGLVIGDSGSVGGSGSFLYDSVQDEMLFVHRGTSTVVTSSVALMGPETYDNLGNETYLTNNRIPKGAGNEHLVDSNISDDGSKVTITGGLDVIGAVSASTFTGLGNLTTYSSSVDSRIIINSNSAAGAFTSASAYSASAASRMLVFATTGSNTFTSNQIVSGSLTTTGDLTINSNGAIFNRTSSGEPFLFFKKNGVNRGSIYGIDGGGLRLFDQSDNQVLTMTGSMIGISETTPTKKLTVNFGTSISDGLLVTGIQRQETRFKSSGEHSNVFIDSGHSNIYLPTLALLRSGATFGEVKLQRASNSDSVGSFAESEMIIGSTTSVPVSIKTNEVRRIGIASGGNVTVYNSLTVNSSLSVNGNMGARNFNKAIKSFSSNGAYTWSTELDSVSGFFDSAGWYKGFIREANGAHYYGYQFDIHVGQIGYGGASLQYVVRNMTFAGGPWLGGCGVTSFAAIDNSGFTKQNSGCFDTLELFITKLG